MRAVIAFGCAALVVLVLTGCPPTGIVCNPGTIGCNAGCVDPANDKRNCGACGQSCGNNRECVDSVCTCGPGTTSCPDGTCAVIDSDPNNCGGCGVVCGSGQVCEASMCKMACTAGVDLVCSGACVDPGNDPNNCGGCGNTCASGQSCRNSVCTFDVVAACYWSGQVVGLNATTLTLGSKTALGTNPGALTVMEGTVLMADGQDQRLYQASISQSGLSAVARANQTGAVPNQVLVDGTFAYVVNAGTGSLQVLQQGATAGSLALDAGVAGGVQLGTVGELNFGMNSYPQGVAKAGGSLWVPLYGGFGAAAADAGQMVSQLSLATPSTPTETARVSLKGLDLHAFDGGHPVARPWAVAAHANAVYVVLNNLNPDTYVPEGPGLLARIDPSTKALSTIVLGSNCLNPQWLAEVGGTRLAVSCGGVVTYSPSFTVDRIDSAGVVVLDEQDHVFAQWSSQCPADAGTLADGGPSCAPMLPGRFTVRGSRILLGDQNAGRVVVLDVSDAGVTEVRGVSNALATCPISPASGAGNVSDLVSVP